MFLFICVICGVGVIQIIDRHGRRRSLQVCEKVWGSLVESVGAITSYTDLRSAKDDDNIIVILSNSTGI